MKMRELSPKSYAVAASLAVLIALTAAILLVIAPIGAARTNVYSDYKMIGPGGQPFQFSSLAGSWSIVSFGFTHCPDFCPTALSDIADVLNEFETNTARPAAVFVTIDPERDGTELLDNYVRFFHPEMMGITGPLPATNSVARDFGVFFEKVTDPSDPETYTMAHSTQIFVVSPDGFVTKKFQYGTAPRDIASYLEKMGTN